MAFVLLVPAAGAAAFGIKNLFGGKKKREEQEKDAKIQENKNLSSSKDTSDLTAEVDGDRKGQDKGGHKKEETDAAGRQEEGNNLGEEEDSQDGSSPISLDEFAMIEQSEEAGEDDGSLDDTSQESKPEYTIHKTNGQESAILQDNELAGCPGQEHQQLPGDYLKPEIESIDHFDPLGLTEDRQQYQKRDETSKQDQADSPQAELVTSAAGTQENKMESEGLEMDGRPLPSPRTPSKSMSLARKWLQQERASPSAFPIPEVEAVSSSPKGGEIKEGEGTRDGLAKAQEETALNSLVAKVGEATKERRASAVGSSVLALRNRFEAQPEPHIVRVGAGPTATYLLEEQNQQEGQKVKKATLRELQKELQDLKVALEEEAERERELEGKLDDADGVEGEEGWGEEEKGHVPWRKEVVHKVEVGFQDSDVHAQSSIAGNARIPHKEHSQQEEICSSDALRICNIGGELGSTNDDVQPRNHVEEAVKKAREEEGAKVRRVSEGRERALRAEALRLQKETERLRAVVASSAARVAQMEEQDEAANREKKELQERVEEARRREEEAERKRREVMRREREVERRAEAVQAKEAAERAKEAAKAAAADMEENDEFDGHNFRRWVTMRLGDCFSTRASLIHTTPPGTLPAHPDVPSVPREAATSDSSSNGRSTTPAAATASSSGNVGRLIEVQENLASSNDGATHSTEVSNTNDSGTSNAPAQNANGSNGGATVAHHATVGGTVFWYSSGDLRSYPEGEVLAVVESLEVCRGVVIDPTCVHMLSRRLLVFRDKDNGAVLSSFEGKPLGSPVQHVQQRTAFHLRGAKMVTETMTGPDPSDPVFRGDVMSVKHLQNTTGVAFSVPVFIHVRTPQGNYEAHENYDYFSDKIEEEQSNHFSMIRVGHSPPFADRAVMHLIGWRIDTFELLPQSMQVYVEANYPSWQEAPRKWEEHSIDNS